MVIHVHPNCPSDSRRAAATPATEPHALDRGLQGLAPLIHELLSRGLVRQSETGAFVLRDDVQQRLSELSEAPVASAPQVFIGRKCETCGLIRVTRLVRGLRMCSDCDGLPTADPHPPSATLQARRDWRCLCSGSTRAVKFPTDRISIRTLSRGLVRFDPALRTAGELMQAPEAKTQMGEADSVGVWHESPVDRYAA